MDRCHNVLVTGANGYLGSRVVFKLAEIGVKNITCFIRSNQCHEKLEAIQNSFGDSVFKLYKGNIISQEDVEGAIKGIDIIIHCAAAKGGPFASMYLNTVIGTRNLLEASSKSMTLKRIVHVSSMTVYGTANLKKSAIINENTQLENNLKKRDDAYTYVKLKQELIIRHYQKKFGIPVVIVRPGVIYGPGGDDISRRVGINLLGYFLNIGKSNLLPLSYIDNCADAIIKAGIIKGVENEVINIIDNDLCTCNEFLKMYEKNVKKIKTIKIPYFIFWLFSWLVETYSCNSNEQIPSFINRYKTASIWKKYRFENEKLVRLLGWSQTVDTSEGLARHFSYIRKHHS